MQVNIFNSGDDLVLPGADSMPPVRTLLYPVASGLLSALYLGHGAVQAVKNIYGEAQAEIVGTPAFSSGFVTLDSANFIDVKTPESASMSLFVLARRTPSTSGNAVMLGNHGASSPGASIYTDGADVSAAVGSTPQATALKSLGVANAWRIHAFTFSSGTLATVLRAATASAIGSISGTITARTISSNGTLQLGAGYGGTFAGRVDVAAASVHGGGLGTTDVNAVIAHLREYAADLGLVLA